MNEKLPKPMLDALARAAKPADHPSEDVLGAFGEHALAEAESEVVTEHLATCAECREVVFLASNAAEDQVAEREDDLQIAALRREFHTPVREGFMSPTFGPVPSMAPEARAEEPRKKPPVRWWPRLVWAGSVAAVLVLAAGYFAVWERPMRLTAPAPMASNATQQQQTARPPAETPSNGAASIPKPEVPAPKTVAKAQPKPATPVVASAKAIPSAGTETTYDLTVAAPAPPTTNALKLEGQKPAPETTGAAVGGAVPTAPGVAVPRASGFAPPTAEVSRSLGTATSGQAAISVLQSLHPGWRVTAQGHIEHHAADGWTQVLADQKESFRVVAVVGGEVWAGGNGGMLFHSSDGGQSWKKVKVPGAESAAVISIRFDDRQNGIVTADDGSSYATSDGGATWAKQ